MISNSARLRGKPVVLKSEGKLFYVETDSALYEKAGSDLYQRSEKRPIPRLGCCDV